MLDQALPIGINVNSPVTWFVFAVVLIVLALTISARRENARPRTGFTGAQTQALTAGARARYTDEWSAAQALFVESPRAGCERAQTIVASLLDDRSYSLATSGLLDPRYRAACAVAAEANASTEDLRAAFIELRAVFNALLNVGLTE